MTRKSIGKQLRFEVFKRDGFKCQYCGAHPPGVLLHVDHIRAVAEGGGNEIDNLVTSCEPCNLGKGARALSVVPQSLQDKAAAVAEREEQLRGYSDILEARRSRLDEETWRVLHMMTPETTVPRDQYNSVRMFIEKLGVHEVMDAMDIALGSTAKSYAVFRYFCGVCWNKVRESQGG